MPDIPRFETIYTDGIATGTRAICEPDGYCRDGHRCGRLDIGIEREPSQVLAQNDLQLFAEEWQRVVEVGGESFHLDGDTLDIGIYRAHTGPIAWTTPEAVRQLATETITSAAGFPLYHVVASMPEHAWYQTGEGDGKPGFVDVAVYEVEGIGPGEPGPLLFEQAGARTSMDSTEVLADAVPQWAGSVKWDGCANWDRPDTGCMAHVCSAEQAGAFALAIRAAYDTGFLLVDPDSRGPRESAVENPGDSVGTTPEPVDSLPDARGGDSGPPDFDPYAPPSARITLDAAEIGAIRTAMIRASWERERDGLPPSDDSIALRALVNRIELAVGGVG